MKTNELRNMTVPSLQSEVMALLKEQFNVRMQRATGQVAQTHSLKRIRREIARIKTIINEKEVGA